MSIDQSIIKYNPAGKLYVWKYNERNPNRRHWNFSADGEGCNSLLGLLVLMRTSKYSSEKEIATYIPGLAQISIPNDRNEAWHSKPKLEIKCITDEPEVWQLSEAPDRLKITAGIRKIQELENAVLKLQKKEYDFAITNENDDHVLYFWYTAS